MKVSKIILNGEEYEFAAPEKGWQPGANTLVYLPLNGDTSYQGSSITGVTSGSGITWETISGTFKGLGLNGNNTSYLTLQGVQELTSDFTISVRAKFNSVSTGSIIRRRKADSQNQNLHFVLYQSKFKLNFFGNDNEGTHAISTNTWYHLTGTYNNTTKECKIYIDTSLDKSTTFSGNPDFGTNDIIIGISRDYYSDKTDGIYSNRILEDKARTEQEITDYYNLTKSLYGIS